MKKSDMILFYFNYLYVGLLGGVLLGFIVIFYINLILMTSMWAIYGALLWILILILSFVPKYSPILLKISNKKVTFICFWWKYVIVREHLKEIIIEPTGIIFLPKEEYASEFRWIANFPDEPYAGYKVIKFANYRAIGALIEALQPITGTDSFDKIRNPKWRKYLEEKVYGN